MTQLLAPPDSQNQIVRTINTVLPFLNMAHGPWVAGGAVRRIAERQENLSISDIDVFFSSEDKYKWTKEMIESGARGVWRKRYTIVKTYDQAKSYRFDVRINTMDDHLGQVVPIQLIKKAFYPSVEAMFDDFDFTICMFATDGANMVCDPRAPKDLIDRKLVMHQPPPKPKPARLAKYCSQGFTPTPGVISTMSGVTLPTFAPRPGLYFDEY